MEGSRLFILLNAVPLITGTVLIFMMERGNMNVIVRLFSGRFIARPLCHAHKAF